MGQGVDATDTERAAITVSVPMLDGVVLATDVYLPPADGVRRPTVLSRVPYDRSGPLCFLPLLADRFLERGWTFVAQDVRGKFASDGERVPFASEASDGWATLEWIANQPWSDGRVVMIGDSYCGYTQLAAASSGHPALVAIAPRVTSDEIAADWTFRQGVPCIATVAAWALFAWSESRLAEQAWDLSAVPLSDLASRNIGRRLEALDQWFGSDDFRVPDVASWSIPTLHLAGWWDVFRRGQFTTWARNRAHAPETTWLHVGATDHQWTRVCSDGKTSSDNSSDGIPSPEFVDRYLAPVLAFFDHVLNGGPAPAAVEAEVAGRGIVAASSWPPSSATGQDLYLVDGHRALDGPEGGGLAPLPDTSTTEVEWIHDPTRPVPDLIADPWSLAPGLPDERDVEVRDDVLTFTSAEHSRPTVLAGPVEVVVDVDCDGPSTHVAAKLVDVDPLGRARRICEGIALVSGPFPARAVVDLGPVGYQVEPGHLLRLEIASSMFPRFAVHPGTGEPAWTATERRSTRQRLVLGPGRSRLRIWTWDPS